MKQWYVYMLECRGGSFYTGYTNNLEKRLKKHQSGKGAKYTRSRLPVKMIYACPFLTKSEAMKNEVALKSMSRKLKLEFLKLNANALIFKNPPGPYGN